MFVALRRLTADAFVRYLLYLAGCVPLAPVLVALAAPWYGTLLVGVAWYLLAGRVAARLPVEGPPREPADFWAATAEAEDWPDDAETRVSKAAESWPNREAVTTAGGLLWVAVGFAIAFALEPALDGVGPLISRAAGANAAATVERLRHLWWLGGVPVSFVVSNRLVAQYLPAHAPHLYPEGYARPLDDPDDGEGGDRTGPDRGV